MHEVAVDGVEASVRISHAVGVDGDLAAALSELGTRGVDEHGGLLADLLVVLVLLAVKLVDVVLLPLLEHDVMPGLEGLVQAEARSKVHGDRREVMAPQPS